MTTPPHAVAVTAAGLADAAAFPLRDGDALSLCVLAKATFALVEGAPARRVPAEPILRADVHHGGNPTRSIRGANELVPPKPRVDVTLVGHARALGGVPRDVAHVTLLVAADGAPPLIGKTLRVVSDRGLAGPTPFTEMPLVWERAAGGPGVADNPLGVGAGGNTGHPNLVDPNAPGKPVGFAPIAASWPVRRKRVSAEQRKGLSAAIVELSPGFDRGYFQCAPADQQAASLAGDEWIVLEGTSRSAPRLASRLPRVEGSARLHGLAGAPQVLRLRLEDLVIDADANTVSVVFRGVAALARIEDLARVTVVAAVASHGEPVDWSAAPSPARPATAPAPRPPGASPLGHGGTLVMAPEPPAPPHLVESTLALDESAPAEGAPARAPAASGLERERTITLSSGEPLRAATPFRAAPTREAPLPPPEVAPPPPVERAETAPPPAKPHELTLSVDPAEAAVPSMPFVPAAQAVPPALLASFPRPPWTPASRDESPFAGTFALSAEEHATAAQGGALPFLTPLVQELPAVAAPEVPPDEREVLALLPRRRGEAVPVVSTTRLRTSTIAWEVSPPEATLTVVVKGTFELVDGSPARLAASTADPTGDLYLGDDPKRTLRYPSDYAIFKPRADVTLVGHAHAPGGRATGMEIGLSFGHVDRGKTAHFTRRAAVIGDRTWTATLGGKAPAAPAPFETIPLVWERAFGGPGFAANPAGCGYHAAASGDGVARLPCIEEPKNLVTSPSDVREPVCFAPLPPIFPRRWSRVGTYDKRWRDARWPYFPEDFDWSFFQAAPKEQQLDYLVGDEPFVLTGVVPGRPRLTGTLPGVRPRVFLAKEPEEGGELHELVTRLDTVTFEPDAGLVHLVWRGMLRVRDEGAPEVRSLFVTSEELAAPLGRQAIVARLHAALVVKAPEVAAVPTPPPANDVPPAPEDPRVTEVRQVVDKARKEREEKLASLGIRAEDLGPEAPSQGTVDRAALEDVLRKRGYSDAEIAATLRPLDPPDAPPPDPTLRDLVLARMAAGEPLSGLWLPGADLSGLDLEGQSLAGTNLQRANLRGARLVSANLEGCQLGGADLREVDATAANGRLADLTGAKLEGSTWDGARLDFTALAQTTAEGASFRGARGERPVLTEADLTGARFDGAELEHASFLDARLDRAVLTDAKLPNAVLFGAHGEALVADRLTLTAAGAEHARFAGASFIGLDAEGSTWERADLRGARLTSASLAGASFLRARLGGALMAGAGLREATLRRANLVKTDLRGADLLDAILDGADLRAADLSGANLFGVSSFRAELEGVKVDGALLGRARLGKKG